MCFGDDQTSTKTTTPNSGVTAAANSNLNFASNLRNTGFQAYGGQQVANIDPQQQASINAASNIANNGTGERASNLINNYASAGPQSVQAQSIAQNMSPYMNQYVMQALAPQLHQFDVQD